MKKLYRNLALTALVALGAFYSCKKEYVPSTSPDMNYFPVKTGKWTEYVVDSIVHADNDNNNDDSVYTYHYFIKEVIDHAYVDDQGNNVQVIYRFKRNSTTEPWSVIQAWTQRLNSIGAYRTEDNIPLQKMAFPIRKNTVWNGNAMNTQDEEKYSYTNLHKSFTINEQKFDSTVTIVQADENNYIERLYSIEIYAAGVGMIYKENDRLEKRIGIVVEGTEYRMQLIGYGE